jgi:hypothetical protein
MAEPSRSPDPGVVPSDSLLTVVAARCRAAQRDFSFFHIFIIKTVEPHNLTFNLRLGTPRAPETHTRARGSSALARWGRSAGGRGVEFRLSGSRARRAGRDRSCSKVAVSLARHSSLATTLPTVVRCGMAMALSVASGSARSSPRPRHGSRFDKVKNTVNDRRDLARDPHPGRGAGGARARRTWRGGGGGRRELAARARAPGPAPRGVVRRIFVCARTPPPTDCECNHVQGYAPRAPCAPATTYAPNRRPPPHHVAE